MRISVVIPTHNRPASLLRLLRALRDGTFPPEQFEVVVVADGCSDDTVVRARAEDLPYALRVLEQNPGRGAAAARNLGATTATGDLLVFLDDDIEPSPALLAEHWREYERAPVATAVVGPPLPVRAPNAALHAIAAWGWWEHQFAGMSRPGHRFTYDNCFSGNLSLPRSCFSAIGGFDVEFNNCRDDSELGLRVLRSGGRIAFAPAARAWHHELRDTKALIRRKQAEGIADVRLARLYPELWPTMYLGKADPDTGTRYGMVRRAAFSASRLGGALAALAQLLLTPLEGVHMRRAWRTLQGALMYYWYWRGVARALGDVRALAALREQCEAYVPPASLHIDLALGIAAAGRAIETASPAAVTLSWGDLPVGTLPATPGAEPLGARHLVAALAHELAQPLTSAIAAATAAGASILGRSASVPVSVVIPAFNAAETLGETLESLLRQTHTLWEAIVVDDGSTDATAQVAARYAARDRRIRVLRQANRGGGAARNAGLAAAQHEWVLFLDADDWLLPNALEALTRAVASDATLDVVHGGWSRVTADGSLTPPEYCVHTGDIFHIVARYCALRIHSALVRRSAIAKCGPFDATLRTCADWDFWQRLARSGARFGRIHDAVACYRMRAGSASSDATSLWRDGQRVIAQGHARDPHGVQTAHPEGAPREQLADARYEYACWVAGLVIGQGGEPSRILDDLRNDKDAGLNPELAALQLCETVPLASGRAIDAWDDLWPSVIPQITDFFTAVERQCGAPQFAARAMHALERLTLEGSRAPRPFRRGRTLALALDVAEPLSAPQAPPGVDRAHYVVSAAGERIGTVLITLGADVEANRRALAAEISLRLAWPILGWFLRGGVYRDVELRRDPRGIFAMRDGIVIGTELSDHEVVDPAALHDKIGWNVFLQELWGRPRWHGGRFYDANADEKGSRELHVDGDRVTIEASGDLPSICVANGVATLEVDVRVGGAPLAIIALPVTEQRIGPALLRAAITTAGRLDLCRLAVREGILSAREPGQTLEQRLRSRIAETGGTRTPGTQ